MPPRKSSSPARTPNTPRTPAPNASSALAPARVGSWRPLWLACAWLFLVSLGMPWGESVDRLPDGSTSVQPVAPVHLVAFFFAHGDVRSRALAVCTVVLPALMLAFVSAAETRGSIKRAFTLWPSLAGGVALGAALWPNTRWILESWPARLRPILAVFALVPAIALITTFVRGFTRTRDADPLVGRLLASHTLVSLTLLFSGAAWRAGLWVALAAALGMIVLAPWSHDPPHASDTPERDARRTRMRPILSAVFALWSFGFAFVALSERQ